MIRLLGVAFCPKVDGADLLPSSGGFVIAANHLSGSDSFAIAQALGSRPVRTMAKNELFARPLLGRLVRLLGAFPAHNRGPFPGGVERAAELAAAGAVVVIFPEGMRRRSRAPRPRTGAAHTALEAGVPLVPVALRGTDGWRRGRRWNIAIGDPVALDDLHEDEPAAAAREATRRLWRAVTALEA